MEIKSVEKLTHEKWLNLFAATFEHKGHTGRWAFATRKPKPYTEGGDAVAIVPVLRNPGEPPRLVLVKEFRVPVGDYVYALPAGLIDEGETVETTARRETAEETGLEVVAIERVTQPLYSTPGMSDEAVALAFVEVRGSVKPSPEATEDISVELFDYEGVCRLCDDRSVKIDIKAWTVLYLYQRLGKLA